MTSAFAVSGIINLPVIISISLFVGLITYSFLGRRVNAVFILEDFFIGALLLVIFISSLVNSYAAIDFKPFNHLLAYSFSIFFFYYVPRVTLSNIIDTEKKFVTILKIVNYAVFFACLYAIFEFTGKNLFGFDVDRYVFRPRVQEYEPLALGYIIRARSFVEESGHFAFYLEIFAPISFYYSIKYGERQYRLFHLFQIIIVCFALLCTVSVSSIIIIPIAFSISFILFLYREKAYAKTIKDIFIWLVFLLGIFIVVFWISDINLEQIVNHVSFKVIDSSSVVDRISRLRGIEKLLLNSNAFHLLIGYGPGAYKALGLNPVNMLYPNLLFEIGLLGLLIFGVFIFFTGLRILHIQERIKYIFLFSFFSSVMHFSLISNYWYPWFWFLCAFVLLQNGKSP